MRICGSLIVNVQISHKDSFLRRFPLAVHAARRRPLRLYKDSSRILLPARGSRRVGDAVTPHNEGRPPRASEYLEASLELGTPPPLRRLAAVLGSFVNAAVGYLDVDTAEYDVVITRRGSSAVVARREAGRTDEAEQLLAAMRADLDRLTVDEFTTEWNLRPES